MDTQQVYVVTVGPPGADVGEFHLTEVYVSEDVGRVVAGECMEARGGRERFAEVHDIEPAPHVVQEWRSPAWSVWLERLEVVR